MPYAIRRRGPRIFVLVKTDTGKTVSHHSSRRKAEIAKSIRERAERDRR